MNEVLKQRLVGALILLALGVIFWPIIFVQPDTEEIARQGGIPPQPDVPTSPLEPPDSSDLRASEPIQIHAGEVASEQAPMSTAAPGAAPDSTPRMSENVRSEPPEELVLDADGVPVAWILQVASVSDADKAEALRQRLLALEQKAYVQKISSDGRTYYRVYIGPKFEQARLEQLRPEIDAEFGVSSILRRYVP